MSINNKMKMINDKMRIKHIQNKFLNTNNSRACKTGVDVNKIKEKYASEMQTPLFMSSYYYITKPKPSALVVQSLIQKYKPKQVDSPDNKKNDPYRTLNSTPRHNKRYEDHQRNYSPVQEVNVEFTKNTPIYRESKQNSLTYTSQPQLTYEKNNHPNQSVPYLDIANAMKNNVYQSHRYYPSSRDRERNYDEDNRPQYNSAQVSFRSEYNSNTSSSEQYGICPIKQRIHWLQKEKKDIRLKINSYSNTHSPTKEIYDEREKEKERIENREQVDSYLEEFFSKNNQCNLKSLYLLNPIRIPNLLQRSVLKMNLPTFNTIK